jgi:hypothetical protein
MKWTRRAILCLTAPFVACQTRQSKQQRLAEVNKTIKVAASQATAASGPQDPVVLALNMLSRYCESPRGTVSFNQETVHGHGLIQAHVTIEVQDPSQPWVGDGK